MKGITLNQKEPQTHQKAASIVMNQLQSILNVERKVSKEENAQEEAPKRIINTLNTKRNSVVLVERRSRKFKLNAKSKLHINIPKSRDRVRNHDLNTTHEGRSFKNSKVKAGLFQENQSTDVDDLNDIKFSKYFSNKFKTNWTSNRTIQVENEKSTTLFI